jgi:hypothetical protein
MHAQPTRGRTQALTALLVGLLCSLLLLEVSLRLYGQSVRWGKARAHQAASAKQLRVLCVGESTTFLGAPLSVAYPELLEQELRRSLPGTDVVVVNGGIPSVDSHILVERIDGQLASLHPHVIVAMMGANDSGDFYSLQAVAAQAHPWLAWSRTYQLLWHLRTRRMKPSMPVFAEPFARPRGLADFLGSCDDTEFCDAFSRALKLAPRLGVGRAQETLEAIFERALTRNPASRSVLRVLTVYYETHVMSPTRALPHLLRARQLWPQDALVDLDLARNASERHDVQAHQAYLASAVGKDYTDAVARPMLLSDLASYLCTQHLDSEAEALFQALDKNPGPTDVRLGLPYWYWTARDRQDKAAIYAQRLEDCTTRRMPTMTWESYHSIYTKAREQGATLICAQYAGRSIRGLQALTRDMPGSVITDNREPFHRLIATGRYDELFVDHCYGDLGHGSTQGNAYLARNIARTILDLGYGQAQPR